MSIFADELEQPCSRCMGRGYEVDRTTEQGLKRADEAPTPSERLARIEWAIAMGPRVAVRACSTCRGYGVVPTERGEELLGFLHRYSRS